MKNIMTIILVCGLAHSAFSQNFGIDEPNPQEKLHVNGSIRGNIAGALRFSTGYGYVDVGPQNSSWSHFQSDRGSFYFNTKVTVDGNVEPYTNNTRSLGTSGLRWNNGQFNNLTLNGVTISSWPNGADNLGNHLATTTLNLQGNNISGVNDIVCDQNFGAGLVGVYSSTVYQNVFAMGTSYRLATNGLTPGNLYGLAWTHTNVGGQSKSPLSHQLLVMDNGVTKAALGSGIWTDQTSYLNTIYDLNNTGYYLDANSTSRQSVVITDENYNYGWFRNHNVNTGLYHQNFGRHFYSESASYWTLDAANGLLFRNAHAGTLTGYTYWSGGSFGLLSPNGNWRFRCDNTNTEAYGSGFYAPTSQIGFIYDRDNTGYYWDANSFSQTSAIYANNWFRAQGTSGLHFESYGGGWHMTDGSWIRSYGGKNVYVDAQLRSDGGLVSGPLGGLGGGTINANGNIINSRPSQGTLGLTGDLPGYAVNTYPTVKCSGAYMYISAGNAYSSYISTGGTYTVASSRGKKENIEALDKQDILKKINALELTKWNYKMESPEIKHIGPFAEDFHAKFGLNGKNRTMISTSDPAGVALVGIQALSERIEDVKTSSDFGSVAVNSNEMWVSFNESFTENIENNALPAISLSSNNPGVKMYISEKNVGGFKINLSSAVPAGLVVDYIAILDMDEPVKTKQPEVKYAAEWPTVKTRNTSEGSPDPELATELVEKPKVAPSALPVDLPADFHRPEEDDAHRATQVRNLAKQTEVAKRNYTYIPEDAPQKNRGEANPSKDGAPKN